MKGTAKERFLAKVNKTEGCWEWTACLSDTGYGTFYLAPENRGSHQAAWLLFVGDIPVGKCVLHSCDNRKCVRPDHLFLGSKKDNSQDMMNKGRANVPKANKGEAHGNARLKNTEVEVIKARLAAGEKGNALAREFGVSVSLVSLIKRGLHR